MNAFYPLGEASILTPTPPLYNCLCYYVQQLHCHTAYYTALRVLAGSYHFYHFFYSFLLVSLLNQYYVFVEVAQ